MAVETALDDRTRVLIGPAGRQGATPAPAIPALRGALGPERAEGALAGAALQAFLDEADLGRALVRWFGRLSPKDPMRRRGAMLGALDRDIAAIDALLTAQVNAVLHHPRFQRLEAAWRGVRYLVGQAEPSAGVKVRILHLPWTELCRDLERAIEFDQSQIFIKVYNEEFGMPGGEPFGVLLGDYQVQHRPTADHATDDVAALKGMSQVAAAAFAPFIAGCAPALFEVDRFRELGTHIDLHGMLNQIEYSRWREFQASVDARFVGVAMPRVLMRLPHADDGSRIDGFRFAEELDTAENYLWGTPVYAFGGVLIRSFVSFGWFADIRGAPRDILAGGLVPDLPICWFDTDPIGIAPRSSTDLILTETQDAELSELGFVSIRRCKDTDYSAFFSTQSVHVPKSYDRLVATVNARLSAMLQYVFCVSRVSHYIKVIARDRVGAYTTAAECEALLMGWLRNYTLGNDDASFEAKAKYPLREASVRVSEVPGRPGSFTSVIHLRPHFQLEQIVTSFRLVAELATAPNH